MKKITLFAILLGLATSFTGFAQRTYTPVPKDIPTVEKVD
jgi:hypothetical protein